MCVTTKDRSATIYWNLHMETVNTTLFICSPFLQTKCDPFKNSIVDLYSANITSNSSSFISVLTIKYVTPLQHHTRWYCFADTQLGVTSSAQYDLNVFAAAEIPTCNAVTLINEINIQISCSTQKVFPGSVCIFYIYINSSSEHELDQGSISYTHQQNVTTGYYTTNCNYTVSVAILGPGSHMFRAEMYPNITSNITERIKTTSQYTSPITIGYPKAVLGTNCYLKDFIKENETSICTCYDNNTSFLPTQVTWSTGNSKDGTLNFTARRPTHTEMRFQCVVSNILNFTNVIIYQPIIAYPPDIFLTLNNAELDLCLDENHDIYGSCSVSDSYPSTSVSIYINNVLLDANHVSKSMDHRFNTSYTSSGVVNVTCLAYNVAFSVSKTKYLTIKGPPERPNIFELIKKETISSSQKSHLAIIMCQSRGGVPSSKLLSLACDTMETDATNGDTVTLEVNMTRASTDLNCTCVVWHESKCLQNITTESLRLYLFDDYSPVDINSAAVAVGVTLGFVLLVSISVNIFIMRRFKSKYATNFLRMIFFKCIIFFNACV
ncbi:unnamed protein product [Lymnaea stagnalis]|uniref:Ig-like domain-containing protein n=1 Tax=Lymnaea stagnalis TaxID=6523 RepID=A0AAV2HUB8_LYMST